MSNRIGVRMIVGAMIATIAGFAVLMYGLFHGLGWQECLAIIVGATLLAGGITYTIQRFSGHRDQFTI
jgi:NhaP-type Na+/H+ or K+/H+ antiporter